MSKTTDGGFLLSPACDLINTRLHVNDLVMALSDELFADAFETKSFEGCKDLHRSAPDSHELTHTIAHNQVYAHRSGTSRPCNRGSFGSGRITYV